MSDPRHIVEGYGFDRSVERVDLEKLHLFLTTSYWAAGRSYAAVEMSVRHSAVVGLYREGEMVGFARAVTDWTVFAQIMDVVVWPAHRGQGFGQALVKTLVDATDLAAVRIWNLRTNDAHGVYEKLGFRVLKDENSMRLDR